MGFIFSSLAMFSFLLHEKLDSTTNGIQERDIQLGTHAASIHGDTPVKGAKALSAIIHILLLYNWTYESLHSCLTLASWGKWRSQHRWCIGGWSWRLLHMQEPCTKGFHVFSKSCTCEREKDTQLQENLFSVIQKYDARDSFYVMNRNSNIPYNKLNEVCSCLMCRARAVWGKSVLAKNVEREIFLLDMLTQNSILLKNLVIDKM